MIERAADEAAILEVAYSLEEAAASTYLVAIGELEDAPERRHARHDPPGRVAARDRHRHILGKDPSEYLIEFLTTDAAVDPADYPAE